MDDFSTIALVSGANRGIGRAVVTGLAEAGIQVLLGARDLAQGEAVAAELVARGLKVKAVQLDTTNNQSVAALAQSIEQEFGRLDILINNAGIGLDFVADLSVPDRLAKTFEVNVYGTARLTEAMLPLLAKSKQGRIVNVSSELASFGRRMDPTWAYAELSLLTYAASKAAVNALTVGYAKQLAATPIKINSVCPGYTATEATGYNGRPVTQAAAAIISFALLDAEGPTGVFVNDAGELPW